MRNALLMYTSAGKRDSGVMFEWCVCAWDENGKWYDIYSSGIEKLTTPQQAMDYLLEHNPNIGLTRPYYLSGSVMHGDLLDTRSVGHMTYLAKSYCVDRVWKILECFNNETFIGHRLKLKCCKCGQYFKDHDDISLTGLQGCGGLMMQHTEYICNDCQNMRTCDVCENYYDDEKNIILDEENRCTIKMCECCVKARIESYKKLGQEKIKNWNKRRTEKNITEAIDMRDNIEKHLGYLDRFNETELANCN